MHKRFLYFYVMRDIVLCALSVDAYSVNYPSYRKCAPFHPDMHKLVIQIKLFWGPALGLNGRNQNRRIFCNTRETLFKNCLKFDLKVLFWSFMIKYHFFYTLFTLYIITNNKTIYIFNLNFLVGTFEKQIFILFKMFDLLGISN